MYSGDQYNNKKANDKDLENPIANDIITNVNDNNEKDLIQESRNDTVVPWNKDQENQESHLITNYNLFNTSNPLFNETLKDNKSSEDNDESLHSNLSQMAYMQSKGSMKNEFINYITHRSRRRQYYNNDKRPGTISGESSLKLQNREGSVVENARTKASTMCDHYAYEINDFSTAPNILIHENENPYTTLQMQLVKSAKEQQSCRELQDRLTNYPSEAEKYLAILFTNYNDLKDLIFDKYGNYFIQKILGIVSPETLEIFLKTIQKDFVEISHGFYSTRVIQELLHNIRTNDLLQIFTKLLCYNIIDIGTNTNSLHVIYNLITLRKDFIDTRIYSSIEENIKNIACVNIGASLIQRIIPMNSKLGLQMVDCLVNNCIELSKNDFSSYTIKFVLEKYKDPRFIDKLIEILSFHLEEVSKTTSGSTVIERCFELLQNNKIVNKLYDQLFKEKQIERLLIDPLGNFVVQKAVDCCLDYKKKEMLLKLIEIAIPAIPLDDSGRKIYSTISIKYKSMINIGSKSKKKK